MTRRKITQAIRDDWQARAERNHPCTTPPPPPFVVWLENTTNYITATPITPGYYYNHEECLTTLGPFRNDAAAWEAGNGHVCGEPQPSPRTGKKRDKATTHCLRGHEYTPENTIRKTDGYRSCRECQRQQTRAYRARVRAKKGAA